MVRRWSEWKYPNAWDKYCKLVCMPSFVTEMAISGRPDQTALLRMSFHQGMHCLIWPVRLNIVLILARCMPHLFCSLISMYK